MSKIINIGNKQVGADHPCFFIAEIGSNHNGDIDIAKRMIDLAAEAGVDAVKFQTFRAKTHYSKYTPGFNYSETIAKEAIYDIIERLEIDWAWHEPLKDYSERAGLEFMTSPCDYDAVDLMQEIGMTAFKIASFDIPDVELIAYMAKTAKPVILSTGLATMDEIGRAVQACRNTGNGDVVVLQCTSMYPAPIALSNLHAMSTMQQAFDIIPGYSDHTMGDSVMLASVAMGAKVIEKHYTLDRAMEGPDHKFAMEPTELKDCMVKLRNIEAALGDGQKTGPRPEEQEQMVRGRRSLHVNRDIKAGELLKAEDMITKRPNLGIEPYRKNEIVGKRVLRDIPEDHWIEEDMLES